MRIILAIAVLLAVGCQEGERGQKANGWTTSGTFSKCSFEGHDYILYSEGTLEFRVGGLEHDPDCKKCSRSDKQADWTIELTYGGAWLISDADGKEFAGGMSEQDARHYAQQRANQLGIALPHLRRVIQDWER